MVCVLPKDILHMLFSYTQSKSVNETLGETLDWAKKHLLDVANDYGFLDGEVQIECVFVCNNTAINSSLYAPTYVPVFGNWEPHISFNLWLASDGFEVVVLIEWEDWEDPSVDLTYKREIKFLKTENPFEDFDLEATAPRSAGGCKEALLAFRGVNVGDDLCDREELDEIEKTSGLLIVKEQQQVYRGKELAEFVLE